jgi:hypothetical protein
MEVTTMSLGTPDFRRTIVAKYIPKMMRTIGNMVSTARVLLSLTYISIFFFISALRCKKNTNSSASVVIEYSSSN